MNGVAFQKKVIFTITVRTAISRHNLSQNPLMFYKSVNQQMYGSTAYRNPAKLLCSLYQEQFI